MPQIPPSDPFARVSADEMARMPTGSTAVVYCEGQFGEQDGKTANGLVRHSEKYEILSVIDSRQRRRRRRRVPRRGRRTASPCSPASPTRSRTPATSPTT